VDLKGISDAFYRKMSRATLKPVLDTIVTLKEKDIWVEITHLIVPTWNDAEEDTRKLVRWVKNNCGADTPLHFSRFYPMHELRDLPATPEATLIRAAKIAREEGLHYIYTGNMPTDGQTDTLCPSCHHVLIERRGYAIKSNTLKDGKCPDCNALIPGKWL
jgi:pyruvate formate lyase activating enzyme